MNSKYLLIIILTAFVIVGLYHVFAVGRFNYPEYRLKEGQVAETEILAPFDFPILKSSEQLSVEQEESIQALPIPYQLSDEALFEAFSRLDEVWEVIYSHPDLLAGQLSHELAKAGFMIPEEALKFAGNPKQRDLLYEKLRGELNSLYNQGIYEDLEADSLSLWSFGEESRKSIDAFLSVNVARDTLAAAIPEAEGLILALSGDLIRANIMPNNELRAELSQRRLREIPQTEGVVLQNEVIIRKNSRVSQSDIDKLESLQAAFRNRNVGKSIFQQTLIALGMLIYFFTILLLTNYYSGVSGKEEKKHISDYLPVNLGFILLTLFAILANHVFSLNNLLIPFALTAIAAAILVSVDFGILYSVCSMLIISPFINWETFPPVIFVLSTISTLVLIKRQKTQHEYLTIWFYLVITTSSLNLALSLYKSDPINILFRNIGFSLISSAISIMGIIMVVPYYEKKWNRATKQTLLELLDFNHPLLKKLATSAVGTYHHSLIVGNLAERAAEAIGANPLLARVGSYYHDIGKIINTEIFTENNEESSDIHDEMTPDKSASLIKNHVLEGVTMARKYKIPQPVIDIITQHHGNSTIRYFHDQAEKMKLPMDSDTYKYPGPRPQSKEAALVMIADIVESTTKAKTITSEKDLEKIIDDTISRLIREGQFDEAPITMKDLAVIKESMMPVLGSIYRKRLDYPEENDKS
ncbi:MAG: HDIG domain-containing protein [Candidatus Cloacimonadaceae bacterium]|nr:HDIG domain-containing protein [Candidatus Cloacimonadota bacterium]MCK9241762.1 HDIG domain-containing protein [Candidatus Cloacimonadota bacterium]MDD3103974.1 HDIG domain-containing protein [Candidatus Cloacimonadota bacterium]MDY0127081.1 HDIG domain-containing protein [Candidatus Cloacimonadaceae bacterium]